MTISYSKDLVTGTIKDILPIDLKMVRQTGLEPLWDELVRQYHYLGHGKMPGANLKYLAFSGDLPIAAISFRAASLHLGVRDRYIDWTYEQRKKHLPQLANNNRFLILPWVRVKNLGSYLLSLIIDHLIRDWLNYYGQELLLLETFVDPRYFQGTVYKAAGWVSVGQSRGFTRQGRTYQYHGNPKEVYLYPLKKDFRQIIGCHERPYLKPSFPPYSAERSRQLMSLLRTDWNPEIVAELNINSEEVEVLSSLLLEFCEKIRGCFERSEQHFNAIAYLKGLMSNSIVKTIETIAIAILGVGKVRRLQHYFTGSNWKATNVTAKHQEELAPKIADDNGMYTIDSSEIPKKGKDSAGVAPQYCGNLGKVANCQSGVFLGYASEKGYGLLDQQLYVPKSWFEPDYAERRRKTHFPEGLVFKTKLEIALDLLKRAEENGSFRGRWVGIDSTFGQDQSFREIIGKKYYYMASIRSDTLLWRNRPEVSLPPYKGQGPYPKKNKPDTDPLPVVKIAKDPSLCWEVINLGEGAKGPIIAHVTRLRVIEPNKDGLPGNELWLFLRKNTDGEIKYMLSNAPSDLPFQEMIRVSQLRWTIEQIFQEGKSYLGLDEYEIRSYPGWHRHMALVSLAMHFLMDMRIKFGEKKTSLRCR